METKGKCAQRGTGSERLFLLFESLGQVEIHILFGLISSRQKEMLERIALSQYLIIC